MAKPALAALGTASPHNILNQSIGVTTQTGEEVEQSSSRGCATRYLNSAELPRLSLSTVSIIEMGQHGETNVPMIPMDSFGRNAFQEPPPYAYTPLSDDHAESSAPTSPRFSPVIKPVNANIPPPRESIGTSQVPPTPSASAPAINSTDPLILSDERFAEIILTNVIQPRLRVGMFKWKDTESFEYLRQSKEDVSPQYIANEEKAENPSNEI
jgi:hypothetical protein